MSATTQITGGTKIEWADLTLCDNVSRWDRQPERSRQPRDGSVSSLTSTRAAFLRASAGAGRVRRGTHATTSLGTPLGVMVSIASAAQANGIGAVAPTFRCRPKNGNRWGQLRSLDATATESRRVNASTCSCAQDVFPVRTISLALTAGTSGLRVSAGTSTTITWATRPSITSTSRLSAACRATPRASALAPPRSHPREALR